MASPAFIIGNLPGLIILSAGSLTTEPGGLSSATVEYLGPPGFSAYPAIGSSHPNYSGLKLESRNVTHEGWTTISATYVGIIGNPAPINEQDTQVIDGGIRFVTVGGVLEVRSTRIIRTITRQRGVSTSPPSAPTNGSVSWTQRSGYYIWTKETIGPAYIVPNA